MPTPWKYSATAGFFPPSRAGVLNVSRRITTAYLSLSISFVSDAILASAAAIANEWRMLAAGWHLAAAAVIVALWQPGADGRSIAAVLSLMPLSVAAMAAWSGNPVNLAMFLVLGLIMLALAGTAVPPLVRFGARPDVAAGAALCAFGWVYPHFLDGSAWQYLYAAPLGLLPCPTLAFLMGLSLATNSFDSKPWAILLGSMGLLYGVTGVFILRVTIDWFLIAGGAALVARAAAPIRLPGAVTHD